MRFSHPTIGYRNLHLEPVGAIAPIGDGAGNQFQLEIVRVNAPIGSRRTESWRSCPSIGGQNFQLVLAGETIPIGELGSSGSKQFHWGSESPIATRGRSGSNWSPSAQRLQIKISMAIGGIFHQLEAWQKSLQKRLCDQILPLGVETSIWSSRSKRFQLESVETAIPRRARRQRLQLELVLANVSLGGRAIVASN